MPHQVNVALHKEASLGTTAILAKLYLPLALFVLFATLAVSARKAGDTQISVSLGGITLANIPISSLLVLRLIFIVLALISAAAYLLYDYTTLFSKNLTMQVYYDQAKLDDSIKSLEPFHIPRLVDSRQCPDCQHKYFVQFDQEIKAAFPKVEKFFTSGSEVHSTGKSYTVVQKTQGLQNYRVTQSGGILLNELDSPNQEPITFQTKNEKLDTPHDYLKLGNVGALNGLLLFTKYKQILLPRGVDECGLKYKVALYAATKVSIFSLAQHLQHGLPGGTRRWGVDSDCLCHHPVCGRRRRSGLESRSGYCVESAAEDYVVDEARSAHKGGHRNQALAG